MISIVNHKCLENLGTGLWLIEQHTTLIYYHLYLITFYEVSYNNSILDMRKYL